jgi:hypothetical protein
MCMAQEGLLPASASQPSPVPPATSPIPDPEATTSDDPPPPIQGRLFDRAGRGTGGELAEKQRISREITASATKRKALVDSDIEVQPSPKPADIGGKKVKQAKRLKSQAVSVPPRIPELRFMTLKSRMVIDACRSHFQNCLKSQRTQRPLPSPKQTLHGSQTPFVHIPPLPFVADPLSDIHSHPCDSSPPCGTVGEGKSQG